MLFEVCPLEVVAQLGVEVVPKTEGLPGARPHERVSAPAGHTGDTGVAPFHVGRLWQFNLNWHILYGFLSITQPRIKANTYTHITQHELTFELVPLTFRVYATEEKTKKMVNTAVSTSLPS